MSGDFECCDIRFIRVNHFGNSNVIRRLAVNLKYFLEWGLLQIGAWNDIATTTPIASGNDPSRLRFDYTPGYQDGQVWVGIRKNWVYESGVAYEDEDAFTHNPLVPTVYVDGTAYTGDYQIDYDLGRVIFPAALDPTTEVNATYSFKNVQVYIANDAPWLREIQFDSFDPTQHFLQDKDGSWFVGGQHRAQLPLIIIEPVGEGRKLPNELGDFKTRRVQNVHFHVMAADQWLRDNLVDLLILQTDRCLPLFDIDAAMAACDINLYNYAGTADNLSYPHLINKYTWAYTRGEQGEVINLSSPTTEIHVGTVKVTHSIIFGSL